MEAHPPSRFPDPRLALADGPVAVGGDLSAATLVDAYRHGIFPWPHGRVLAWWSPDPRAVIPVGGLHVSRTLRRTLSRGTLAATVGDPAFGEVVRACAARPGQGTWITREMVSAYERLHRLGLAHAVAVRDLDGALAGGLYGVALNGAFMGESMVSRVTGASKVALAALDRHLVRRGFTLFDVQLPTAHLRSMGAVTVPRGDYLDALDRALALDVTF